ncbi:unnamed protein product [Adineta steineri]|uniref:Uncharacterized protein n=1 Tax=Adineta steineri TaxID=433720 RepID=A0A818J7T7_9BILA|nr:unnamed protein product [Adineta steineri]CAF1004265.1 unnamed protein product [Adineta steineri]CAF3531615.1 unnamed protein product [Adineta steineri]CAF3612754.1 unnamed protein product [Adineta steineri]
MTMTILPFLDIKATPLHSIDVSQSSRIQTLPRVTETNISPCQQSLDSSYNSNKLPSAPKRISLSPSRVRTPKIKIFPRSDETLKQLPHPKTIGAQAHNAIWKPLIREPPDYDYLWEPVKRDDIRHQYDHYIPSQRITASRPDEPYKMSTGFETEDRHYHNYRRVRAMQQKQWNKEHIQYTVYPYSQITERETYNKHIRSTLKGQMEEKTQSDKNEQARKSRECQSIIEQDRQDIEKYKQKQKQQAQFLFQFTAKNKELMENKWEYDRWNRAHQWHVERVILSDNPINWSKTMT